MSEEEKNNIKVIAGHNSSILQQIERLLTFVGEIGAIGEYEKRSFTNINVNLVLNEISNNLNNIAQSVRVIEQVSQELLQEYDKPKE